MSQPTQEDFSLLREAAMRCRCTVALVFACNPATGDGVWTTTTNPAWTNNRFAWRCTDDGEIIRPE